MTAQQSHTFAILVEGLWSGEISENEAVEVAIDAEIPPEKINAVLSDIRDEDQTWG